MLLLPEDYSIFWAVTAKKNVNQSGLSLMYLVAFAPLLENLANMASNEHGEHAKLSNMRNLADSFIIIGEGLFGR